MGKWCLLRVLKTKCNITLIKDKQNHFLSITVLYHQTTETFYTEPSCLCYSLNAYALFFEVKPSQFSSQKTPLVLHIHHPSTCTNSRPLQGDVDLTPKPIGRSGSTEASEHQGHSKVLMCVKRFRGKDVSLLLSLRGYLVS